MGLFIIHQYMVITNNHTYRNNNVNQTDTFLLLDKTYFSPPLFVKLNNRYSKTGNFIILLISATSKLTIKGSV